MTKIKADALDRDVVGSFQAMSQIKAIYSGVQGEMHQFVILLSPAQYDDAVMNRLLAFEYDLGKRFHEHTLSFLYIPLLGRRKEDVVNHAFRLLFER